MNDERAVRGATPDLSALHATLAYHGYTSHDRDHWRERRSGRTVTLSGNGRGWYTDDGAHGTGLATLCLALARNVRSAHRAV